MHVDASCRQPPVHQQVCLGALNRRVEQCRAAPERDPRWIDETTDPQQHTNSSAAVARQGPGNSSAGHPTMRWDSRCGVGGARGPGFLLRHRSPSGGGSAAQHKRSCREQRCRARRIAAGQGARTTPDTRMGRGEKSPGRGHSFRPAPIPSVRNAPRPPILSMWFTRRYRENDADVAAQPVGGLWMQHGRLGR